MSGNDSRQIGRDSLLVLADLRIDGLEGEQRIRVRNLSAGGLMAEGSFKVLRGVVVWVNLRNIGWIEGSVAWVQDNRFGIAFREEIDPRLARAPTAAGDGTPRYVRPPLGQMKQGDLRKI
ncbi:MAG: PilZ domain-containing protein [Novosphingobium sp.]